MKIKQTADELEIRETPGCLWVFSGLFIFVGGIFIYGALGGFSNWNSVSWRVILLTFLMGSIAAAVGFWTISNAPVTTVTINRINQSVALERYGLTGKTRIVYDFEQIRHFRLLEEKDSDGDLVWSLGMEFTSGKVEKISSLATHFQGDKQKYVFQTNEFMGKQMPSAQKVFEIADENET